MTNTTRVSMPVAPQSFWERHTSLLGVGLVLAGTALAAVFGRAPHGPDTITGTALAVVLGSTMVGLLGPKGKHSRLFWTVAGLCAAAWIIAVQVIEAR